MPGADAGGPLRFIVVEFLNGGTLADRSKRLMDSNPGGSEPCNRIFAGFPARELFVHLRDLSSVLSYLHGAGHERELSQRFIMHRDLKSANIAFHTPTASADKAPKLKLLDLGLARRVRRAPHQTPRTGTYKQTYPLTPKSGTFRYMSPEIAAGGQYNASADVYSFAFVAWEMAAGRVPFAGIRPDEFYTQVLAGTRRPPMGDKWPPLLRTLLTRCWEKDPKDRPTMKEVRAQHARARARTHACILSRESEEHHGELRIFPSRWQTWPKAWSRRSKPATKR